jgi:hypothetical protein
MRAAYVSDLYSSYGADPLANDTFNAKLKKYALEGLALDARDNYNGLLAALKERRVTPWLYRDPQWDGIGPVTLAKRQASADNIAGVTIAADIELHDPNYVIAWLVKLRALGVTSRVVWTLEPMQGGWFTRDLVDTLNADPSLIVLPQQYHGDGSPAGTIAEVRNDVIARGVLPQRVKIMVRAGDISPSSFPDGCAYTLDEGAPWGLS